MLQIIDCSPPRFHRCTGCRCHIRSAGEEESCRVRAAGTYRNRCTSGNHLKQGNRHCCKVSDEAAFCLIQRPYISKTLLTRRISPRGSP
ncbi:hypothetical protein GVD82_004438 [Salmonella enterica]|nr:hypothetical protein [Salmonella enterica subsp. enterica serovar Infantis]